MSMYDFHRRATEEPTSTPAEISASLAALLPDQPTLRTIEATAPQPTLRIRVEHSRTIKDGWSYSTTVEVDDAQDLDKALGMITEAMVRVRKIAEMERNVRDERDNLRKEATAQIVSTAS